MAAATVEGVFRIIDRASGPMRKMMAQAKATDAMVNKLGRDLDRLGNRQQIQQITNIERGFRNVRTEGDRLDRTLGQIDRSGSGVERTLRNTNRESAGFTRNTRSNVAEGNRFVNTLIRMGAAVWGFRTAVSALKLPAMLAGIGALVQVAVQLAGAVVTLLPQLTSLAGVVAPLPAVFVGMGLAMITVKLATKDLTKALGGNKQAIKDLTPEARSFVLTLKQYAPVIKEIRREAQKGLFPGLEQALRRAQRGVPLAKNLVRRAGAAIGQGVSQQVERLTTNQSLADLGLIGDQGIHIIERGIRVIGNLLQAAIHFAVAARPFTDWLTRTVEGWSKWIEGAAKAGRESGRIAAWLDKTRSSLTLFGHILRDVFFTLVNIGKAARPTGDSLWKEAERAVKTWRQVTGSFGGQLKMVRFFAGTQETLRQTVGLVSDLARALFRMGNQQGSAVFVAKLRELVPVVEQVLNTFVTTFMPVLLDILIQVGKILALITSATGPINILLTMIAQILTLFNNIVNISGAVRQAFTSIFSIVVIGLFVRRLTAATSGMLGFSKATDAAAAAQARLAAAETGGVAGSVLAGGAAGGILRGSGGRTAASLAAAGARPALTRGGQLAVGLFGARVAARAAPRLIGTGLRAAGKFAWPILAGMGLYDAATAKTEGNLGWSSLMRGSNAISGATFGLVPAMKTAGQIRDQNVQALLEGGRMEGTSRSWGWHGGGRGLYDRDQGAQVTGLNERLQRLGGDNPTMRQGIAQVRVMQQTIKQLKAINSDAATTAIQGLQGEIRLRQQVINTVNRQKEQERQGRGLATAKRVAGQYGTAFNMVAAKEGVPAAMTQTVGRILGDMNRLPEAGAAYIARGSLRWAHEAARQNPKLIGEYERLKDGVVERFRKIYDGARVWNDKIITGSRTQWKAVAQAMTDPIEQVKETQKTQFTEIQQQASQVLQAMGFSGPKASLLVGAMEQGGSAARGAAADVRAIQAGVSASAIESPRARGGRIPGAGLRDTVPIGGAMAAPGELIVNRHTEAKINALLSGRTTLGREVAGERTPHYMARGGRVAGTQLPSTFAATHDTAGLPGFPSTDVFGSAGSPVYSPASGRLVDPHMIPWDIRKRVGGGTVYLQADDGNTYFLTHFGNVPAAGPVRAGQMIGTIGAVPGGAWASHIHEGLHSGLYAPGSSGGGRGGSAMAIPDLKFSYLGGGGVPGALSFATGSLYARAARARIGQITGGTAGVGGGGGPLPAGGGSSSANMALARSMMVASGFAPSEWSSLQTLWMGESGFNNMARNPSSGAFGIPQALPASKMGAAAVAGSPSAQIAWGLDYIRGRYGSPSSALSAWQSRSPHWYEKGGRVPFAGWHANGGEFEVRRPTLFGAGEAGVENVKITRGGGSGGATVEIAQVIIHNSRAGDIRKQMKDELAQAWNDFTTTIAVSGAEE